MSDFIEVNQASWNDVCHERDRLIEELKASTDENKRLREKLEIMGKTEGFSADTKIEQAKHIHALESNLAVARAALKPFADNAVWAQAEPLRACGIGCSMLNSKFHDDECPIRGAEEALQRMGGEER